MSMVRQLLTFGTVLLLCAQLSACGRTANEDSGAMSSAGRSGSAGSPNAGQGAVDGGSGGQVSAGAAGSVGKCSPMAVRPAIGTARVTTAASSRC